MDEAIMYAVIVAWTPDGKRAYSILGLDNDRRPVDIEPVYVGELSQAEFLRQWLHDITGKLEDGQRAIVFTNHVAARTKSHHVADFPRVTVLYSKDYTRRYSMAMQVSLDTVKKENGNDTDEEAAV